MPENCWIPRNGKNELTQGTAPCGPVTDGKAVTCCWQGDTCLDRGFCKAPPRPGTSQYYFGACTDPTFSDPACRPECVQEGRTDAIYDYYKTGEKQWTCCGADKDGVVQCDLPIGRNFTEVAPDQLFGYAAILSDPIRVSALPKDQVASASSSAVALVGTYTPIPHSATTGSPNKQQASAATTVSGQSGSTIVQASGAASATSQMTGTASALNASGQTASAAAAASNQPLSGGAIAGIVIGIVALLTMIAGGFFLVYRMGKKARKQDHHQSMSENAPTKSMSTSMAPGVYVPQQPQTYSELSPEPLPYEMSSDWHPELESPAPSVPPKHHKQMSLGLEHYEKSFL